MTRLDLQRRWAIAIFSVLSGAVIFWTALHSEGFDWFISETHADIIYSGLRRFGEYPFFSFVVNGGSYFIQDPQSNLFSPAVPLIWLAGPSIGLRLNEALVVGVGVYGFVVWMRTWVSTEAALVGGVASATSLGVLWKVAVGNDMFMWHMGLPWLLWGGQQVIRQRNLRVAVVMGLWLGVLLLGPTFHSFTYLFVPVGVLYLVFELVRERLTPSEFRKVVGLFAISLAIALLIVSPKLACWLKFPMARPIGDHGVTSWRVVLRALFDYGWVRRDFIQTHYIDSGIWLTGNWWMTEEAASAMPPLGTALSLVGVVVAWRSKTQRALAGFSVVLIVCGVALASIWPVWNGFRWLTGGNFRVAQRFFGMSAAGLAVLATLGADACLARVRRYALPVASAMSLLLLGSALWWTRGGSLGKESLLNATPMSPREVWSHERELADELTTFDELVKFDSEERLILEGTGYKDGFLVVGNKFKRRLYKSKRRRSARHRPDRPERIVVEGIDPSQVKVTHLGVTVKDFPANTRMRLRVMEPLYGLSTRTVPPDADVEVINRGAYLAIQNFGDKPVSRVKLQVQLPVWKGWFLISASVCLGALLTLSGDGYLKRRVGPLASGAG